MKTKPAQKTRKPIGTYETMNCRIAAFFAPQAPSLRKAVNRLVTLERCDADGAIA